MNKIYLELKNNNDTNLDSMERIIPVINLSNSNNKQLVSDNKSRELERIIDKEVCEKGYLDLKSVNIRVFLGVKEDVVQDLAIEIFNRYLEHSNIERAGGSITIWNIPNKKINDIMKVSSKEFSVKSYCPCCGSIHNRMKARFKNLNVVETKCNTVNQWNQYNIVEV